MRIRIDLLAFSERRQQGPVSTRFALRTTVLTLILAVILGAAWLFFISHTARSEIQTKESAWRDMEPLVKAIRRLRGRNADAQAFLNELDAWAEVRQAGHVVLEHIQRVVPAEMQFVRLEIRDDITARRPSSEAEPARPYRQFRMRINGRTAGERSEDTVARFLLALKDIGAPNRFCPSVSLVSLQSDPQAGAGFSSFEINAEGEERPLRHAAPPARAKAP